MLAKAISDFRIPPQKRGDPWEFDVRPGLFKLQAEAVLAEFSIFLARMESQVARGIIRLETPAHQEYLRHVGFLSILRDFLSDEAGAELEWISAWNYHSIGFAGRVIHARHFSQARCRECNRAYAPQEIEIEEWMHSRGFEGGKRVICPGGHILFASVDWLNG